MIKGKIPPSGGILFAVMTAPPGGDLSSSIR